MYFYIGVSVAVIVVVYFLFGRSPAPPKVTIRKDARLIPAAGLKGTGLKKKTKKSEEVCSADKASLFNTLPQLSFTDNPKFLIVGR
jgi:hypothetical protein